MRVRFFIAFTIMFLGFMAIGQEPPWIIEHSLHNATQSLHISASRAKLIFVDIDAKNPVIVVEKPLVTLEDGRLTLVDRKKKFSCWLRRVSSADGRSLWEGECWPGQRKLSLSGE